MSFKVPNIPICVAVACCGVALIFQIVAVAGTGWVVSESGQVGLFRVCASGVCVEITSSLSSGKNQSTLDFKMTVTWHCI